ncbi:hypothetical protein GCM10010286_46160 [Streptomyces toxytricini]|nr:hypothetical protein GCM10010286_46160 [Streptomyces toxytricini]
MRSQAAPPAGHAAAVAPPQSIAALGGASKSVSGPVSVKPPRPTAAASSRPPKSSDAPPPCARSVEAELRPVRQDPVGDEEAHSGEARVPEGAVHHRRAPGGRAGGPGDRFEERQTPAAGAAAQAQHLRHGPLAPDRVDRADGAGDPVVGRPGNATCPAGPPGAAAASL